MNAEFKCEMASQGERHVIARVSHLFETVSTFELRHWTVLLVAIDMAAINEVGCSFLATTLDRFCQKGISGALISVQVH